MRLYPLTTSSRRQENWKTPDCRKHHCSLKARLRALNGRSLSLRPVIECSTCNFSPWSSCSSMQWAILRDAVFQKPAHRLRPIFSVPYFSVTGVRDFRDSLSNMGLGFNYQLGESKTFQFLKRLANFRGHQTSCKINNKYIY